MSQLVEHSLRTRGMETDLIGTGHRDSLLPKRGNWPCHQVVPAAVRSAMMVGLGGCALATVLDQAPEVVLIITSQNERDAPELGQTVAIDAEHQKDIAEDRRADARLMILGNKQKA